MAALPEEVLDQGRRTVEPGVLLGRVGQAGDRAALRRRARRRADAESECLEVNGVGWFDEEASGKIFTTIGRAGLRRGLGADGTRPSPARSPT